MLGQNIYVDLYKQRVAHKSMDAFATELAMMHNAMGVAIKELFQALETVEGNTSNQKEKEGKRAQSSSNERSVESGRSKKFNQKKVRDYCTKNIDNQRIEEIEQESSKKSVLSNHAWERAVETSLSMAPLKQERKPEVPVHFRNQRDQTRPKLTSEKEEKKALFRENQKNNANKDELEGVECGQCRKFYGVVGINSAESGPCKHFSRHKTNAPLTRVKNWSQEFEDF